MYVSMFIGDPIGSMEEAHLPGKERKWQQQPQAAEEKQQRLKKA